MPTKKQPPLGLPEKALWRKKHEPGDLPYDEKPSPGQGGRWCFCVVFLMPKNAVFAHAWGKGSAFLFKCAAGKEETI